MFIYLSDVVLKVDFLKGFKSNDKGGTTLTLITFNDSNTTTITTKDTFDEVSSALKLAVK